MERANSDVPAPDRPPRAPRRPHVLEAHGDRRVDDWWWLRDRDDPAVLAYLEAENAYADAVLAPTAGLQERLFDEIRSRVVEDDVSAPERRGPYWYWSATATGAQYRTHHRLADPARELTASEALAAARSGAGELLLDENALAAGSDYFALGVLDVSGDHRLLAFAVDLDGSERYRLAFRDLAGGRELDDVVEGVTYGSAWSADSGTFFYVRPDEAMRPFQVWRHVLGEPVERDALVFEEGDERFSIGVGLTRSRRYVLVESGSRSTSEVLFVDAATPADPPVPVVGRIAGVEYDVEHAVLPAHGDVWLVRSNGTGAGGEREPNFSVVARRVDGSGPVATVVAHRDDVTVDAVDAFAGHLVVTERAGGVERLRVVETATGSEHVVEQPDPVYALGGGANAEWDATSFRFVYSSLVAPPSTVDYAVAARRREVVKVQDVPGYDAARYVSERVWATAGDGEQVPISLVRRADLPPGVPAPCVLYGYGAYEISVDPAFSVARVNLLERGVVFAIAHVRGGGELGRRWWEAGHLEHKANTFDDFVACAEHLVASRTTAPDRLVARGGSAGGLLVGAVVNRRPDLFAAAVAEVPFVDVVTTMSDPTLPLTVGEWEEWGDPAADAAAYTRMLAYSPYDNVRAADYPALYVTAGLNDPRVGYFEPAKWVAKLRATGTGSRPVLLRTELGAGHLGPSGRYDAWRDEARVQAFVLSCLGLDD